MIDIKGYVQPQIFHALLKTKKNFKLLGLDIGKKKIGLAICNTEIAISLPLTIFLRKNTHYDVQFISNIIAKHEIDGIIIGLPMLRNPHGDANIPEELMNHIASNQRLETSADLERLHNAERSTQKPQDDSVTYDKRTHYIVRFTTTLSHLLHNIPITFQDESFTTQAADALLKSANIKRIKRNAIDDAIAASLILDNFINNAAALI